MNGALAIQVATLGIRAVIAASLTNLMSGAIAGMFVWNGGTTFET